MNDSAANLEKLRELNAMDEAGLNAQFAQLLVWLKAFVRSELGLEPAEVTSSPQLRQVLIDLASNKKAWSRRLASIVIDANKKATDCTNDAIDIRLRAFTVECPWRFLRESAERHRGSRGLS